MLTRLALTFLLLLAILQLPFSYFVLTQAAHEGQRYLDLWYRIVAGPEPRLEQPLPQPVAEGAEPRPAQAAPPGPDGRPADAAIIATETPPVAAPVEPDLPSEALPRRRIVELPEVGAAPEPADLSFMLRGLAIDYVSVPPRPLRGLPDEAPVALTLQPAPGRRVVLLAGRPGLSWWFREPLPEQLAGVLVLSDGAATDEVLYGLPETLPVGRIEADRQGFPFVRSVVPSCIGSDDPFRAFVCSNVVEAGGEVPESEFQRAERAVGMLLRGEIATLSSAFADRTDRVIGVPEEIVDETLRERARSYLERHEKARERALRYRDTLRDYAQRFIEERRSAVLLEQSRHAPFRLGDLVSPQPRLLVVSAYQGASPDRGSRQRETPPRSYQDFADRERNEVGVIEVEIASEGPVIVVATAQRSVDWKFQVAEGAQLLGVQIEGHQAPLVAGLPNSVPLKVRSHDFGDRDVAGYLTLPKHDGRERREDLQSFRNLARFRDLFQPSRTLVYSKYEMDRVRLAESTAMQEPPQIREPAR